MDGGKSYLRSYKKKRVRNSSSDEDKSVVYPVSVIGKKKLKKSDRNKTRVKNKHSTSNRNTTASEEQISEDSSKTLLTYPPNSGRLAVVSLIASDINTLNPNQFLNDQVIDFWLQYMYKEKLSERDRSRTHVFSSYFFSSLRMGNSVKRNHHQGSMLKNWTKNVNIFKKDFTFIPISQRSHWFLVVICFPYLNLNTVTWNSENSVSDTDNSPTIKSEKEATTQAFSEVSSTNVIKKPCILVFDSMSKYMKDKERTVVYRTLWQFLTAENLRQSKDRSIINFTAANMPACVMTVPQQTNKTDCGLFVFKYFETFFSDPIESYEFPVSPMKKWFDRKEITGAREFVYRNILRLTTVYFPDNLSEVPTLVYCQKMISDEDDENDLES